MGIGGLFGYHALYFAALRRAPPADASLIAYLWPLLIVLFSAALPGERLKARHVIGAALGFAGAATLFLSKGVNFAAAGGTALLGYGLALCCAFVWSGYSVLSRRLKGAPTEAVAGFCLATAALAALCHLGFETTVIPATAGEWLAILGLGLGPVGLAFYVWDYGVKHGDIRLLGVAAYAAPVLSTLILVAAGVATATSALALACALIVGGAVVASSTGLTSRRHQKSRPEGRLFMPMANTKRSGVDRRALRLEHLTAAIHAALQVDVVRAAQFAGILVLDIGRRLEGVGGAAHAAAGGRGFASRNGHG